MTKPTTRICRSTATDIQIRGKSLPRELMGQRSFTEGLVFTILGTEPTPAQTVLFDACLLAIMEHGLTPTTITARLTYTSAPEAMQGAVAAGLSSVGSLYVGTMDGCAHLLARLVAAPDLEAEAAAIVAEHRARKAALPGFGHPQHTPDDPRALTLLALADEHGVAGPHCAAVRALGTALDAAVGRHLTLNATGAIAAVLSDCGVAPEIQRGFALIARTAGLVAHIREEQLDPTLHALWHAAEGAIDTEGADR